MKSMRLKGHALYHERRLRTADTYKRWGRCSCGAISPVDITRDAQVTWHRAHKDKIRAEMEAGNGKDR